MVYPAKIAPLANGMGECYKRRFLTALPEAAPTADDPDYVSWFADLMRLVERIGRPPISYDDYSDHSDGWEVGSGSGIRHPHPPVLPEDANDTTMTS
jgi:hypothetical protein